MGAHSSSRTAETRRPYPEGRHVDRDRQPGRRVDGIPDDWFDPGIDRSPDDPDVGVR